MSRDPEPRRTALEALSKRVERARQGDSSAVTGDAAMTAVEELLGATPDESGTSPEGKATLTWFFWLRFAGDPSGQAMDDLFLALAFFAQLEEAGPQEALEELRPLLQEAYDRNVGPVSAFQADRLLDEFERTRDTGVLESAITPLRLAIGPEVADDPPTHQRKLMLASALVARFQSGGNQEDIDEAVGILRESPSKSAPQLLGPALQVRYERYGLVSDLDEAIDLTRRTLASLSPGHPLIGTCHSTLSDSLRLRYEERGDVDDLRKAVAHGRSAVAEPASEQDERAIRLSNLSNALYARFELSGAEADLDEAIRLDRKIVDRMPPGHPALPKYKTNLGLSLQARFYVDGNRTHLDEAVAQTWTGINETAADDPLLPGRLSNLGMILLSRFEISNRREDLVAAIAAGRQAIGATAESDPNRALRLASLSNALFVQSQQTRSLIDLSEAIKFAQMSVDACPADSPRRPTMLSNFGVKSMFRFRQSKATKDLENAVSACTEAVSLSAPGQAGRPAHLAHLCTVRLQRFEHREDPADLEAAIAVGREAVEAASSEHPDRSRYLSTLATCLLAKWSSGSERSSLDEAIETHTEAVAASPASHPARSRRLLALAEALYQRHEAGGSPVDLDAAIAAWVAAANESSGVPEARITAARLWGDAAMKAGRVKEAADGLERAVRLLPLLVWHGLPLSTREDHLSRNHSLASDAACCAIAAGRTETAVELLEAGRATLWGQALELRGDLSALDRRAPALAEELEEVRAALNLVLPEDVVDVEMLSEGHRSLHSNLAPWRMRIAQRFEELVAEVRKLDGFSGFLSPAPLGELLECTVAGPIAFVNVSRYGCHALLLTKAGIEAVELPGLTFENAHEKGNAMLGIMQRARELDPDDPQADIDRWDLFEILGWLWENVTGPVLDALGYAAQVEDDADAPRIWWCPTGPVAGLPLHAAGVGLREAEAQRPQSAFDRVVSSYVPTLAALARARSAPATADPRLLAVGMPTTPDRSDLAGAVAELDAIDTHWPIATRLQSPTREQLDAGAEEQPRSQPSVERVKEMLASHACVHFACHGTQHPSRPAASAFWLANGPLAITDLLELREHCPWELAVLSACDTAASSVRIPDEAVNLGVSIHQLGFRHVIAALWPIYDAVAVDVGDLLYQGLVEAGPDGSARALHRAVLEMRLRFPDDPRTWAPYVHIGP
jgi:tetratricopeptide (TPR) repeat protein